MKLAAAGGLSLAAMKMFSPSMAFAGSPPAVTGGPTDGETQFAGIPGNSINEKVFNFALTLEFLEADLYRQALNFASDFPKDTPLSSNPNVYTQKMGSGSISKAAAAIGFLYLKQFAYVEAAHRDFLIATMKSLGLTPVTANPGGYAFVQPPSENIRGLLLAILPLEETGVRAYLGAINYITDLSYAQVAASIYSTEARHSAVINYTVNNDPGPAPEPGDLSVVPKPPGPNTFEYYLKPSTVVARASAYFVK
jgi:hypothetical protein